MSMYLLGFFQSKETCHANLAHGQLCVGCKHLKARFTSDGLDFDCHENGSECIKHSEGTYFRLIAHEEEVFVNVNGILL